MPISIIRTIEAVRLGKAVSVEEADKIYAEIGLEKYLYNWLPAEAK